MYVRVLFLGCQADLLVLYEGECYIDCSVLFMWDGIKCQPQDMIW